MSLTDRFCKEYTLFVVSDSERWAKLRSWMKPEHFERVNIVDIDSEEGWKIALKCDVLITPALWYDGCLVSDPVTIMNVLSQ